MGGGGQQQQTTKTEPWSGQQPYLKEGFEGASDLYNSGPQEFFPGQNYTDMDPARSQGLFGSLGLAGSGGNPADAASNYANQTLSGNSDNPWGALLGSGAQGMMDTASGGSLNGNQFLDGMYNAQAGKAVDEWQNTIMPGIASSFGQSGGAGTTMANEMAARSGGELSDTLGQMKSSIYGGNYQQERDRQVQAQSGLSNLGANLYGTGVSERTNLANNAANIRAGQYGDFDKMGEVGKQFEEQQGKEIQGDIDRWNFEQNAPYAALQDYMSMITGNYGSTSTTRSNSSGNPLSTILGAAATAYGASDRRLKEDIVPLAEVDGIKLYTFRYTTKARALYGLPKAVQVGVIAQEVMRTHSHAVEENERGHLMVDYGLLFKRDNATNSVRADEVRAA